MWVKVDLHNHSCLSPCCNNDMTPGLIAVQAMEKNIDILALTDHNSGLNLPPFAELCELCGIIPIFGLEVNTIEEVHVVCLFEQLKDALAFSSYVEFLLPDIKNIPTKIGDQLIVNSEGETIGTFDKTLIGTCGISFYDLVEEVLSRDGLVIPAHIDRPAYSAISNLGFLPELPYSAVEMVNVNLNIDVYGKTIITGSDAHCFEAIGKRSFFLDVPEKSFQGLKTGLKNGKVKFGEN